MSISEPSEPGPETAVQVGTLAIKKTEASNDHRHLRAGEWWQAAMPHWVDVDEATFLDYRWQLKNTISKLDQLYSLIKYLAGDRFADNVKAGFQHAPMSVRITPYLLSLINWNNPVKDPIRRQFIPLGSERGRDHPMCTLDSLHEQKDSVAPGLVHRYPDKVLFLALDVCPVYCRFCTRSYAIGNDTSHVHKLSFQPDKKRWDDAFQYLEGNDAVEDVVVSGGDTYVLHHSMLKYIGERLLTIPHIRRIRFASKGLAVMPQKILTDHEWVDALTAVVDQGRRQSVHVCLHTHVNHPDEITEITRRAADVLFQRGITMRNQTVLQRGVNDDPEVMTRLVRRLAWINIHPYYVYVHDMVPGVETLRTTVDTAIRLEKQVRGRTSGFNTPNFMCDVAGGGGKRVVHSYEYYDRESGIVVYRSPAVDADRAFLHFDPLHALSREVREAWLHEDSRRQMIDRALRMAGF
jgi:lysine 2,3-aminomutase